jgi:hypothetical protein
MKLTKIALFSFHLLALGSAHFSLYTPTAIGANMAGGPMEGTGPCGSFDETNRDNVTNWPIGGYPVYLVTTHPQVVFEFRAALVNDTTSWINLIPPINQYGLGFFCEPAMPGFAPWAGLPIVLQVAQYALDGINYQVCEPRIEFMAFLRSNRLLHQMGTYARNTGVKLADEEVIVCGYQLCSWRCCTSRRL